MVVVRILIVDDHPLYLDAVCGQIERHIPNCEVVTGRSVADALERLGEGAPFNLVILDYSMPGMNGCEGLRQVCSASSAPAAVMSGIAQHGDVAECVAAGAKGFLPKTLDGPVFAAAVNMILLGGTYLPIEYMTAASPAAVPQPTPERRRNSGDEAAAGFGQCDLSSRELEVLTLLVDGASNKEIALQLNIQEVTVKLHATRIFSKLGVRNRSQAAVKALEEKLVIR